MICGDCDLCGHAHISALQYDSICPSSKQGCSGCNMVAKLERDIEATAEKLKQLLVDLQKAKTELNFCHTSIIKKLPTEIVSTIFEDCVASSIDLESDNKISQADVLPIPFKLSQVCKSWKRIAFSTAKIWTRMAISLESYVDPQKLELLQQWIARTKGLSLDISISFIDYKNLLPDSPETRLLEMLLATSKQWRNVYLDLPYAILEALFRQLDSMPNVNHFQVGATYFEAGDRGAVENRPWTKCKLSPKSVIISGSYLRLDTFNIRWDTVTTVHLKLFYEAQCIQLLRSSPKLLSVTLEHIYDNNNAVGASSQNYSTIQHSTIQHFSCQLNNCAVNMFQCLKFPNLKSLQLDATYNPVAWLTALQGFLANSACSLERLQIEDYAGFKPSIIQLLNATPSLQHLSLWTGLPYNSKDTSPTPLLRRLAETATSQVFLPRLKTLEYNVKNLVFPWELVPSIFGVPEKTMSFPLPDQRPLTTFKIINRYTATLKKDMKSKLIPKKILRQLLKLRQHGAEIIYKDGEREDLFKKSCEPSAGAKRKT